MSFYVLTIKNFLLSIMKILSRRLSFFRRPLDRIQVDDTTLLADVKEKACGCGSSIGYRRVLYHLRKKGINNPPRRYLSCYFLIRSRWSIKKKTKTIETQKTFQPTNKLTIVYTYGHGKLKPFGFSLNGNIDGCSCSVIWLKASPSYKKWGIFTELHLDAVRQLGCSYF